MEGDLEVATLEFDGEHEVTLPFQVEAKAEATVKIQNLVCLMNRLNHQRSVAGFHSPVAFSTRDTLL